MGDGNLLVTAVIALAAYGAFELLRRISSLVLEWRKARGKYSVITGCWNSEESMAVFLDHMIVPARDRRSSAELLAKVLDVPWSEKGVGPFCAVYVNDGLTLDFDQWDEPLPVQHYCFRMSEAEFDQVVARLGEMGIAYRSTPHGPCDSQVNTHHGGRIVYWSEPDDHVWEALTLSYAREPKPEQLQH